MRALCIFELAVVILNLEFCVCIFITSKFQQLSYEFTLCELIRNYKAEIYQVTFKKSLLEAGYPHIRILHEWQWRWLVPQAPMLPSSLEALPTMH